MRDFTEDEKALIVAVREHLRWIDSQPPSRYLEAIRKDRQSDDYSRDPDAVNPPSRAHLLRHRGGQDGPGSCPGVGCQR